MRKKNLSLKKQNIIDFNFMHLILGDHKKIIKRLEEEDTKKLIPKVERYKTEAIFVSIYVLFKQLIIE